ncbi:MAG: DNA/RNA non-specific endonuclease [Bacteroidales bacterium]|nr:DNA/RNA non-specific endonuclease [Bacteroidales bacterium]
MRLLPSRFPAAVLTFALLLGYATSCEPEEQGSNVTPVITPRTTELPVDEGSVWVSVTAGGNWSISLSFDGADGWASVDPAEGEGSRDDVRLRYKANEGPASRKVTLHLHAAGGGLASASLTQAGKSGPGGGPDVSPNGYDVAPYTWLELPATKAGDGLTFFVHDMDGGKYISPAKSGVRNWSMYWDNAEHLSCWVAYPLNNKLKGSGSRTNLWGFDPLLPKDAQPDLTGGSYGGGWTRGHQIPSADRLNFNANVSTFYGTNMTPQQYDFNGEIWASLEARVRSYASLADTLYVVTGCLYKDSSLYTGANSGFAVRVPTHYFKALLFKGISTYAVADGYMAAGFLLPHDESIRKDNYTKYIMSIDELESKTGIDFFPNLTGRIGSDKAGKVEAEAPSSWWK